MKKERIERIEEDIAILEHLALYANERVTEAFEDAISALEERLECREEGE